MEHHETRLRSDVVDKGGKPVIRKAGADSRTNRLHCVATRVLVDIAVERSAGDKRGR